jgi:hypothetical protein
MATTGYSGTPLWKKLGFKPGYRIMLIQPPADYFSLLSGMPETVKISAGLKKDIDLIHYFETDLLKLQARLPRLLQQIRPNGSIWISWPKKAAKMRTSIDENSLRVAALATGLVDIKVCAIDDTWSGLKLVIPLNQRN